MSLPAATVDVLRQLFFGGPTHVDRTASVIGLDDAEYRGLVTRIYLLDEMPTYATLTLDGARECMLRGLGREKEARQRAAKAMALVDGMGPGRFVFVQPRPPQAGR